MTLVRATGDLLTQTRSWTSLHDEELRRRAVLAARDGDAAELSDLTTAYLGHLGSSGVLTSPKTVAAYRLGVRQYVEYAQANAVGILRPGRHDAQGYVGAMLAAGRAPEGVQLKVAAARCLYRALRWAGATEADPFRDVRIPKDHTTGLEKRPPYTDQEVERALAGAAPHDRFLLLLTAHAGLRVSEALGLHWNDLDLVGGRVRVTGKGRKTRTVPMSGRLVAAAEEYRALYAPGGEAHDHDRNGPSRRTTPRLRAFRYATVQNATRAMKTTFAQAGVPWRGFHAARKYAGTRLLGQTGDLATVAAFLGHASVDTTRDSYAAVASDAAAPQLREW